MPSAADVYAQASQVLAYASQNEDEKAAWATGSATGGFRADGTPSSGAGDQLAGYYPLSLPGGAGVLYVQSPAKLQTYVSGAAAAQALWQQLSTSARAATTAATQAAAGANAAAGTANAAATALGNTAQGIQSAAKSYTDQSVSPLVPKATMISGGGLVTGGGDLSANRTLTVPAASAQDLTTGTDATKALTSSVVAPALAATQAAAVSAVVGGAASDRNTLGKLATGLKSAWSGVAGSAFAIASAVTMVFGTDVERPIADPLNALDWNYQSAQAARAGGLNIPITRQGVTFGGWSTPGDGPLARYNQITGPGTSTAEPGTVASPLMPWQFLANGGTKRFQLVIANGEAAPEHYGGFGDGATDCTAAVLNCREYLKAVNAGRGKIKLGIGTYFVNGEVALDVSTRGGIYIEGVSVDGSWLVQNHATAPLVVLEAPTPQPAQDIGYSAINNLTLVGRGAATNGNLLEIYASHVRLGSVRFIGTAGRAIYQLGERLYTDKLMFEYCRQALVQSLTTSTNESFYLGLDAATCGRTRDPITLTNYVLYDENATPAYTPGNALPAAPGPLIQSHRAVIQLGNSVNCTFMEASVKPQGGGSLAGLKFFGGECNVIKNWYVEGAISPSNNPSIIGRGRVEKTPTTAAMTTASLSVPVTDARWFADVRSSIARLAYTDPSTSQCFTIFPPDYVAGSSTPSSLGGGILQGSYEYVSPQGFYNNTFYMLRRGQFGKPALAWPAGAIVAESYFVSDQQIGPSDPLVIECVECDASSGALGAYTINSNPDLGLSNGEIVLGVARDIFHVPTAGAYNGMSVKFMGTSRLRAVNATIQCLNNATVVTDQPLADASATGTATSVTISQVGAVVTPAVYSTPGMGNVTVNVIAPNGAWQNNGPNGAFASWGIQFYNPNLGAGNFGKLFFSKGFTFGDVSLNGGATKGEWQFVHTNKPQLNLKLPATSPGTYSLWFGGLYNLNGVGNAIGIQYETGAICIGYAGKPPAAFTSSSGAQTPGSHLLNSLGTPGASDYLMDGDAYYAVATVRSGPTSGRPTNPAVGMQFFDTTLGYPVWCKTGGSTPVWVNSSGATA